MKKGKVYSLEDNLKRLGFTSLSQYLSTSLFREIRNVVRFHYQHCRAKLCDNQRPTGVRFLHYSLPTLIGIHPTYLVPFCTKHCLLADTDVNKELFKEEWLRSNRVLSLLTGLRKVRNDDRISVWYQQQRSINAQLREHVKTRISKLQVWKQLEPLWNNFLETE